jgi:AbrB family looped-hinge helix DNA binding protein
MANATKKAERDFGETTVTSKGQITIPQALRQTFHLAAGDRLRFRGRSDGTIVVEPRKRRRIVDIADANAFRAGEAGVDLDATIDAAINEAMIERERRSRRRKTA